MFMVLRTSAAGLGCHTVIAWAFLFVSLIGVLFTLNAFVRVRQVPTLFWPSLLGSWVTTELAIHHVAVQAVITALFVWYGALEAWPGLVALAITLASWGGLIVLFRQGWSARKTFDEALVDMQPVTGRGRVPWRQQLVPFLFRRRGVRVTRNIVYRTVAGRRLRLDVIAPDEFKPDRPAILQIHGGAWVMGDKREQGLPLMSHLAANGWVCFNLNYRLSPGATFPDHLEDLKYGLAWVREHADEWGVDPGFVAVTGGSAGGHLAAMVALTENDTAYQPGFEDADTSIQAAVPIYGVYDFTNRLGVHPPTFVYRLLQPRVLKAFIDEEPEKFTEASPIDRIHSEAPPFFVIHGDRDNLAPVEEARLFVQKLRHVSQQPVVYAELQGALHAFDLLCSPRTARMLDAVLRFLTAARERHRASEAAIPECTEIRTAG